MTYAEMIATRPQRALEAAKRNADWLANVDLDQLENDMRELAEFESLADQPE